VLAILRGQNDSIKGFIADADRVVTQLEGRKGDVTRFVTTAGRTAEASASRREALRRTLHRLPTFLRELRPTMAELGRTADASDPYLRDLNASAGQLTRFLQDLGPFADSSRGNIRTLAHTADHARPAIRAATPTVAELKQATAHAPELAKNLDFVLSDLDNRNRAVEKDKRSPGGQGYTGFEAVLQYMFDQMMAINIFDENGYILKVNLSASECSDYQNADSLRRKEKTEPGFLSRCLAALGPNQPGVTTADPTDTGVDDPGPGGALAASKKGKSRSSKPADAQAKSRNAPGQPDLKKALEKLLRSGGGGNKPSGHSLPEVNAPALPAAPSAPQVPNLTQGAGSQSADPKALLDYLFSP
jgi:hypothetical protein